VLITQQADPDCLPTHGQISAQVHKHIDYKGKNWDSKCVRGGNARFDGDALELYAFTMSELAIKEMSWDEKLRAMEELWASLTQDESRLESPSWHKDALQETAARYETGQEQPVEWDAAKRELRKRAE
jgi:hypothetical protein